MIAVLGSGVLLALCLNVLASPEIDVVFWNVAVPLAILALGLGVSGLLVARRSTYALTPVPWFHLSSGVYFGFGPLAMAFASPQTREYIDVSSKYPITDAGQFEATSLSVAGIFIVSVTILAVRKLFGWETRNAEGGVAFFSIAQAEQVFWTFVVIGGTVKYLLTLPRLLGLMSFVLPGMIEHLAWMLPAALIIGMMLIGRGERRYVPVMVLLALTELATALMTTSKAVVISVLIAIAIGKFLMRPSFRFLGVSAIAAILFYSLVLSPFVAAVRITLFEEGFSTGSFIQLMADYFDPAKQAPDADEDLQGWWSRLNYQNVQKFGIDMYDTGQRGTSLDEIAYSLVPRILFPDKPIAGYGKQLSDLLMPGAGDWVQIGMGYFAEGYWNGGLWGLAALCIWAGVVMGGYTSLAFSQIALGRVAVFLPLYCGIQAGFGVDRWFTITFVGGTAEAALYWLLAWGVFYRGAQAVTPMRGPLPQ